tara:strand:- start:273 stop:626 length:354 start_codon:yes stop_codon:yes gene_type:complete
MGELKNKKGNTRKGKMIDNRSREREFLGSVGPIVKVTWNDAASTFKEYRINAENPSEHLTVCETIGEMVARDDKAIVIVMHGSQCDGCDIMAIPADWAQNIEILKECTSESSESQQE